MRQIQVTGSERHRARSGRGARPSCASTTSPPRRSLRRSGPRPSWCRRHGPTTEVRTRHRGRYHADGGQAGRRVAVSRPRRAPSSSAPWPTVRVQSVDANFHRPLRRPARASASASSRTPTRTRYRSPGHRRPAAWSVESVGRTPRSSTVFTQAPSSRSRSATWRPGGARVDLRRLDHPGLLCSRCGPTIITAISIPLSLWWR